MDSWHLYLVRCADDSLYCGIATDVARRFEEHRRGTGARYLRGRGPLELVLQGAAGDRSTALRLEARVKRLPKAAKEELVLRPRRLAALRAELERASGGD